MGRRRMRGEDDRRATQQVMHMHMHMRWFDSPVTSLEELSKEHPMNLALWVAQGILAFVFIAAGGMKLLAYQKYRAMLEKTGPTTLTRGTITLIGIVELAGAGGVVLPVAANIAPCLSLWSASGLAVVLVSRRRLSSH